MHTDTSRTAIRHHLITRFKIAGDNLDMATRTEILRFRRVDNGRYHAGGGMVFDSKGNLWFSTGDDTDPANAPNDGFAPIYWKEPGKDAQKSSSNTNDLRGKINRIHPEAAQVGREVVYGARRQPQGRVFLLLVRGRSGQGASGDLRHGHAQRLPLRRGQPDRLVDLGRSGARTPTAIMPNRGRMGHDELNVATKPGFYGWPYCNGNQFAYNNVDYTGATGVPGAKFDCALPVNTSPNNTGVTKLPPSQAPILWYAGGNRTDFQMMGQGGETAMAGPVYNYDKNLISDYQVPAPIRRPPVLLGLEPPGA